MRKSTDEVLEQFVVEYYCGHCQRATRHRFGCCLECEAPVGFPRVVLPVAKSVPVRRRRVS